MTDKVKNTSNEALLPWAKVVDALVRLSNHAQFDAESMLDLHPEWVNGVPRSVNLAEYVEFWIEDGGEGDTALFVSDLEECAEACSNGHLVGRRMLRLRSKSFLYLNAKNGRADSLGRISDWDRSKTAARCVAGVPETQWIFYIEQGFTPFAIGISDAGGVDDDYLPAYTTNDLILIVHHDEQVSDHTIELMAVRYLFELAASANVALEITEYPEITEADWEQMESEDGLGSDHESDARTEKSLAQSFQDGDLKPLSIVDGDGVDELVGLWLSGKYAADRPAAIIAFTRVIEYVSVTVARRDAHNRLRLMLRSDQMSTLPSSFLDKLIEECRSIHQIRHDTGELIKLTIRTCCIPSVLSERTVAYSEKLSKKIGSSSKELQEQGVLEFANSLYATRNSLVHAKANYEPTGAEVGDSDLPDFVRAVEHIAMMCIRWFNEQPKHARLGSRIR